MEDDLLLNTIQLKEKANSVIFGLLKTKGYIAPVDLLMGIDILSKKDYENWRFGRVPYLEKVCGVNLHKLSLIMREFRSFARKNNLRPSWTAYMRWGLKGRKIPLRFSKFGNPEIGKAYSTHFIAVSGMIYNKDKEMTKSEESAMI